MKKLDLSSEKKYKILAASIRKSIESGEFKPGAQIPSENELVSMYNVSRPTVREAVSGLIQEGLLTRLQGKGTFVAGSCSSKKSKLVNLFIDERFKVKYDPESGFYGDFMFNLNLQLNINDFLIKPYFVSYVSNFSLPLPDDLEIPSVFAGNYLFKYQDAVREYIDAFKGLVIFVDCHIPAENAVSIVSKNKHGGMLATEYLLKQGLKKIGFIGREIVNYKLRMDGYLSALEKHNVDKNEKIIWLDPDCACNDVMKYPDCVDGIFCCSDEITANFVNFFRKSNPEIINKIKFITYDYTGILKIAGINVPGIYVDRHEMACKVIDVLDGRDTRNYIEVATELKV